MQNFPVFKQENIIQKVEGIQKLKYPDIVPNHFCWTIVGQPGSGKTTFIEQLLNDESFYKNNQSPINIKNIDEQCKTNQFNTTWIFDRINYLNTQNYQNCNLLIIMDDCISSIKKNQNSQLVIDLFYNRRHLWKNNTISLFITTQQFTMMPLKFRTVCDNFTFLSLSPRDLDYFKKDLIPSNHRQVVQEQVQNLQYHQFLYIRQQPFLICLNFKPLVSGSSYISQSDNLLPIQKIKQIQTKKQDIQDQEYIQEQKKTSQTPNINQIQPTQKFSFKY